MPIISSGQAGSVPTAAQSSRRASRASARLRAIRAGQPPGTSPPRYSIAFGTVSHAVGSWVPVQSNSSRKRVRPGRSPVAPWLIVSGWMSAWRSRRTQRKAEPFGVHSHLWQLAL